MASTIENSDMGGMVLVTIANPAVDVQPDSQPCRYAVVTHRSGTQTYLNLNGAATTSSWKLSTLMLPFTINVRNLNQLHFIGTPGDTVQVLWFN